MIWNTDTDCDADSGPDIDDSSRLNAKSSITQDSPERRSLAGHTTKGRGSGE